MSLKNKVKHLLTQECRRRLDNLTAEPVNLSKAESEGERERGRGLD